MACNYCNAMFCLFRLEKRCPSCGFSFCIKCLDNTIFVKQLKAEKKVCVKCVQYNSSGEVHMIPPPDFCKRNVESKKKISDSKCYEHANEDNTEQLKNNINNGINSNENSPGTSNNHHIEHYYSSGSESDFSESDLELSDEDIFNDYFNNKSQDEPDDNHLLWHERFTIKMSRDAINHENGDYKSTNEILKDAIKQLRDGLQDKSDILEAFRKKIPKCILCSAKPLVSCKGCDSIFCMRCFDMHSDDVCAEYVNLEQEVDD